MSKEKGDVNLVKHIKSKNICGRPVHTYFTGKDKYLRLQRHCIQDITPPISENESLLILVNSGKGIILINGVEFSFEKGAFAWIQSYHTFSIRAFADYPLDISVCVYDYPLSSFLVFEEPRPDMVDSIIDASPILYPNEDKLEKIKYLFDEFEMENESYDPGSSLIKVSILGQLSNIFIKKSLTYHQKHPEPERPLGWKAILYMSAHFSRELTSEEVASIFNTSVSALNRELRNISGYNFCQKLNRIRVNIASMALLYEGMPLSYIATHSGFSSETDFYRTFKKYIGLTPLDYRSNIINSEEGIYRGMIMESTLMKLLNYCYSYFSYPINISNTAKSLYISESLINDLVQKRFGTSMKDITCLNRIRHAEALLLVTDLPILDIAVNVGFNSSRSLCRAFKKIHGITPGEYRTANTGGDNSDL